MLISGTFFIFNIDCCFASTCIYEFLHHNGIFHANDVKVRPRLNTGPRGGSRIFLGGSALRLLLYFNTNKPHSFFFLQNTSCIRKPQVISGEGAHPLHPPPRSAPGSNTVKNPSYHGKSDSLKLLKSPIYAVLHSLGMGAWGLSTD